MPDDDLTPALEEFYGLRIAGPTALADWIAYADKLERVLELVCGESKDRLMKLHAEQGLRLVRPIGPSNSIGKGQ